MTGVQTCALPIYGIEPQPGDAVLVRSGFDAFWAANPDFEFDAFPRQTPGVAVSVLEFLHAHDAALLGWDLQEAMGQGLPEFIHRTAKAGMSALPT